MIKKILLAAAAFGILAMASCNGGGDKPGPDNTQDINRKAVLQDYATGYILPAYAQATTDMDALQQQLTAFRTNTAATRFQDLDAAYEQTVLSYQAVSFLEFGPSAAISFRARTNTYPTQPSKIMANISGSYDLAAFSNYDAQGLPALDYLLHHDASSAIATLLDTDDNYYAYTVAVATSLSSQVAQIKSEWNTYQNTFAASGSTDAGSGFSTLVNAYVQHYERYVRSGKVGIPAGAISGSVLPEHVESLYQPEKSGKYLQAALAAMQNFYEGKKIGSSDLQAHSFQQYWKSLGTKDTDGTLMAVIANNQFAAALTDANGIVNIKTTIESDRPRVLSLYNNMQQLVPTLKVDMVSAFGISITYVDNDGD